MPAIGTKAHADIQLTDATGERTTTAIRVVTLTAANLAAQQALMATYFGATSAIVLGVVAKTDYGNTEIISNAEASDPSAQRESKLLVTYWDVTTQKQSIITIGTIDFSMLHFMPGAGDAVAFNTGDGAPSEITDWVTAFEAVAKAPDTGNAVAVIGMRYVGRNT